MEVITNLFAQTSIESIIIFVIAIAMSMRIVWELLDFFYAKLKKYFNYTSQQDKQHEEMMNSINALRRDIDNVIQKREEEQKELGELKTNFAIVNERLQENTRNAIIDKHHYFCYEIGAIDDLSLQSLERRYLYYKSNNGNSFIDRLMEEIRALPRLNLKNQQIYSNPIIGERSE